MPPLDPGQLGEQLITQWIPRKGGQVLDQRWHCNLGELDVVALNNQGELIFIEVKTRSPRNIDEDGVLSITRTKRAKIIRSAQLYLLKHPQHRSRNCRFDIALVRYQPMPNNPQSSNPQSNKPKKKRPSGFTRTIEQYELTLVNYIVNAFEAII